MKSAASIPTTVRGTRLELLVALVGLGLILAIPPARHALGLGIELLATGQLARFQEYLRSLGRWAPVTSVSLMILQSLLVPVPITILMVANGLVFGVWDGLLVSLIGTLLGAIAAYVIGKMVRPFPRPPARPGARSA